MATPISGLDVIKNATGGKDISNVTSADIIKMASGLGLTQTDIKRAVKGWEQFKKSGNTDIVIDSESGMFDVTGPQGGTISRSKKGAGNVKGFDIGDITGAGRNINYLATILNRQTSTKQTELPESISKFEMPQIKPAELLPKSGLSFRAGQTGESSPQPAVKAPSKGKPAGSGVKAEEPKVSTPETKVEKPEIAKVKLEDFIKEIDYFKANANYPFEVDSPNGYRGMGYYGTSTPSLKFDKNLFDKMIQLRKLNPNMTKENIKSQAYKELSSERKADITNAVTTALTGLGLKSVITKGPGLVKSTYQLVKNKGVVGAAKEATKEAVKSAKEGFTKAASLFKSTPKSVTAPNSVDVSKPTSIMKARAAKAQKYNIEKNKLASEEMLYESGKYKKGGKVSPSFLMNLPKGQVGGKFETRPRYSAMLQQFLSKKMPAVSIEHLKTTPPKDSRGGADSSQKDPRFGSGAFKDNLTLTNAAQLAKYTLPFVGQKLYEKQFKGVGPTEFTPLRLRWGAVRDLPKTYTPLLSRPEMGGSSLMEAQLAKKSIGAFNKAQEQDWRTRNELAKLQQEQAITQAANQEAIANWQGGLRTGMFNQQMALQKAALLGESKLQPYLAAQQHIASDIYSKDILDAQKKLSAAEIMAQYGTPADRESALKTLRGFKVGGKLYGKNLPKKK